MDNTYMRVKQSVDTSFILDVDDEETGELISLGIQENYQAEVHFRRKDGLEIVGKLTSVLKDFRMVPASEDAPEAIIMTFRGENTETWQLKPDTFGLRLSEDDSQVLVGTEELFGTLLLRDANGVDVPNISGADLPLIIEVSTTRGFTTLDVDTSEAPDA